LADDDLITALTKIDRHALHCTASYLT